MRIAGCLILGALLVASGCTDAHPPAVPDSQASVPASLPADYFSPNNPELQKYHEARMNPAITADVVKEKVREKVRQGTVTEIHAEVKDVRWASENTEAPLSQLYTPGSPIWYVTLKGDIPAPDPEIPIRYKSGSFLVEPELGQVMNMTLTEPEVLQKEQAR